MKRLYRTETTAVFESVNERSMPMIVPKTNGFRRLTLAVTIAVTAFAVNSCGGGAIATLLPGRLALTPDALAFPPTAVDDTSAPMTLTLTNVGGTDVHTSGRGRFGLNPIDFDGGIAGCDTIAPGSSCTLPFHFIPKAEGARSATFQITSDGPDGEHIIKLTGNGLPSNQLKLTPNPVTFPPTVVTGIASQQMLTITNLGGAAADFSASGINGTNAGDFSVPVASCGTVAAGGSCTVKVLFNPAAIGPRNATLTVQNLNSTSLHTVLLTGTGAPPTKILSVAPMTLNFADTPVGQKSLSSNGPIVITNIGTGTVTLTGCTPGGVNRPDFLQRDACNASLAPGATLSVVFFFSPMAVGQRTSTFTISSDAVGSPQTVNLSGNGIAPIKTLTVTPSLLNFPDTLVGQRSLPSHGQIVITNTGNIAVNITGCTLGGVNPGDFLPPGGCSFVLTPGSTFQPGIEFAPTALGLRTATFTITSDATGTGSQQTVALTGSAVAPTKILTVMPTRLDFPDTPLTGGSVSTLTVTNVGNTTVTFGFPACQVPILGGVFIPIECPTSIAPGQSGLVRVSFEPKKLGLQTTTLVLNSDATNSPLIVPITGTVVETVSALTMTPDTVVLPSTPVGGTSQGGTLTITNVGNVQVSSSTGVVGGPDAAEFGISSTPCPALDPGQSCAVNFSFSPSALGPRTATYTLKSVAIVTPPMVTLSGTGTLGIATLTVTPDPLVFPDAAVGETSAARSLTFTNTGNVRLTLSGESITGTNPGDFNPFVKAVSACPVILPGSSCVVSFNFRPTATGPRQATYSITSQTVAGGFPSSHSVMFTGNGAVLATKRLTQTPNPMKFPDTPLGSFSPAQTLTITNTGTTLVTPSSAPSLSGDTADFNLAASSCLNIPAGGTCTFDIRFIPTALGARTAQFTLPSDAIGSSNLGTVTGNGVAATRILTVTPNSVSFPPTLVGSASPAQILSLVNTGNSAFVLRSLALSGPNAGDFSFSGNVGACATPPFVVPVSLNCSFTIGFTPTAEGARTATLTITSDATSSPQTVILNGNGVTKVLTAPAILNFPDTTVGSTSPVQTVLFHSAGTQPVTIASSALGGANPADFKITSNACFPSPPLAPGSDCAVTLTFSPAASGARKATLTVTGDGGATATVMLQGNGLAPTKILTITPNPVTFTTTSLGSTSPAELVTVSNTGTAAVMVSSITVGGPNAGDFALASFGGCFVTPPPITVPPGTTCTARITFTPTATGLRTANFTIASDGTGTPQSVTLNGTGVTKTLTLAPGSLTFAPTTVGITTAAQDITVTSTGTAAVNISSIALTGANTGDFTITANTCPAAPATLSSNCKVSVAFKPTTTGARSASLTVASDGTGTPQSVTLAGTGVTKTLTLAPGSLTFAPTIVGSTTASQDITVTSTGGAGVSISSIAPTGANAGDFTITANTCPVAPATLSTNCKVSVAFQPTAAGTRGASLTVTSDGTGSPQSVPLSGTGIAAVKTLSLTPNPMNFPDTVVGVTSAQQTLTIANTGNATVTISAAVLAGTNPGDFPFFGGAVLPGGCASLSAGSSCTINFAFAPTAVGLRTATYTLTSDATGSQTLALTGSGLAAKVLALAPASLSFANAVVGSKTASQDITVTSTGSSAVTISSLALTGANPGDFTITANTCPAAPATLSTNCKVSVAFAPTVLGASNANLTVASDGTGSPQSVPLSGNGIAPVTVSIGGTITGLTHTGLVLANGADTVSPASGATSFVFGVKLTTGAPYNVTVKTQPIAETCTVSSGSGTAGATDVTNVAVACTPNIPSWIWKGGSKTSPAGAVYGTLGTPDPANVPGRRELAVSWVDASGNMWLFGGQAVDSQLQVGAGNDLWRYRPANNDWTWMSGSSVGGMKGVFGTQGTTAPTNVPGAKETAMSWADGAGNLWLFGGSGPDSIGVFSRLNDLWQYNIASGEWTWMKGSSINTALPTYGTMGTPTPANTPGQRDSGVTWVDAAGNLWLFGGEGLGAPQPGSGSDRSAGFLADLWKYTPSTNEWTWMSGSSVASNPGGAKGVYGSKGVASPANAPGHRIQAVSWTDTSGNLWLFGGQGFDSNGNSGLLNDLWKYDLTSGEWTWMSGSSTINATAVFGTQGVPASTNVPDARQSAIGWVDKDNVLWLFGGANQRMPGVTGSLNDLWQYDIGSGNWTWISGSSGVNQSGVYGTLGVPANTNVPGGRFAGVNWVDAAGNLWHFGGTGVDSVGNTDLLNDFWIYMR